jgi:hypothetical protein
LSLAEFAASQGSELSVLPPDKFVRPFEEIFRQDVSEFDVSIPWQQVLPPTEFKKFVKRILRDVQKAFDGCDDNPYVSIFKSTRELLTSLERIKIDRRLWAIYTRSTQNGQVDTVASFKPDHEGFASEITYSRTSSTGRLKIARGPKVLHLRKDYREMFTSRWTDGKIMQIDYVSLEPRVLLAITGRAPEIDIYSQISREVLRNKLTRPQVKKIVMGVLYGAGPTKIQEMIGPTLDVTSAMSEIRAYFGVRVLERNLKRQLSDKGYITNHYGRVLAPNRRDPAGLVSYHVQSTGVDVALLGFNRMRKYIEIHGIPIKILCVIHDAVLIDVHPDVSGYNLEDVKRAGEKIPHLDVMFPLDEKDA